MASYESVIGTLEAELTGVADASVDAKLPPTAFTATTL